jgi:hypothetical protein
MDVLQDSRFIERQQFFNGQRLFADDLQYIEAFNREMRWLHNRSLHQAGIGGGLKVYGEKGDRQVLIGPGYAIDAQGREIVLIENHAEPVPPVAGKDGRNDEAAVYDLVVSYGRSDDLDDAETRQGVCSGRDAVRKREAPVFCWVKLKQSEETDDFQPDGVSDELLKEYKNRTRIVLARIKVKNCQLDERLSITERRSARADCGPNIACRHLDPPGLWTVVSDPPLERTEYSSLLSIPNVDTGRFRSFAILWLKATIPTTVAGFRTQPCYSVSIPGPRAVAVAHQVEAGTPQTYVDVIFVDSQPRVEKIHQNPQSKVYESFDVLVSVVALRPTQDTGANPSISDDVLKLAVAQWIVQSWSIDWMGVEA